jgi:putative sigma-54 modulation protein
MGRLDDRPRANLAGGNLRPRFDFTKGADSVQTTISVRHGHLSDASQEKIKAKVEKLGRIFERLIAIQVTVDLENEQTPGVELVVSAEHKNDFVATDRSGSLMGSLDAVCHKIEQQLRKYKDKVQNRHRQNDARRQEVTLPEPGEE